MEVKAEAARQAAEARAAKAAAEKQAREEKLAAAKAEAERLAKELAEEEARLVAVRGWVSLIFLVNSQWQHALD